MDVIECATCGRMFNNTDNTGVCPNGCENKWVADESDKYPDGYSDPAWLGRIQG